MINKIKVKEKGKNKFKVKFKYKEKDKSLKYDINFEKTEINDTEFYDDIEEDITTTTKINETPLNTSNTKYIPKRKVSFFVYKSSKRYYVLNTLSTDTLKNDLQKLFDSFPIFIPLNKKNLKNILYTKLTKEKTERFKVDKDYYKYYHIVLPNGDEFPLGFLIGSKKTKAEEAYHNYRYEFYKNRDIVLKNIEFLRKNNYLPNTLKELLEYIFKEKNAYYNPKVLDYLTQSKRVQDDVSKILNYIKEVMQ